MTTTIQIEDNIWNELNKRKRKAGETFNEVIKRLILEEPETKRSKNAIR